MSTPTTVLLRTTLQTRTITQTTTLTHLGSNLSLLYVVNYRTTSMFSFPGLKIGLSHSTVINICVVCTVRVSPVVLASKSIDRTALPTRSTRSTIPVQSEAKPSATATVTSPRKSSSAPVSSASKNTGRPVVSKTTTGKPVVSRRPVGGPPKHSVKSFDKPVKPAAKSARRSGAQSPKAAELPTVLECEPTPQSPDVSLAAFVMPTGSHISSWNVTDVVQFIRSTDCSQFANVFQEQVRKSV